MTIEVGGDPASPSSAAALAGPGLCSAGVLSRGQIAQYLRDHAIQRIFAVCLEMTALAGRVNEPPVQSRLTESVTDLDGAVAAIYAAVSELSRNAQVEEGTAGC
jgi:signal transduction histidine kinase